MANKRTINVQVLPGQPTDGSGHIVIHLFVLDDSGPFVEPCVIRPAPADIKETEGARRQLISGPARGRLACDPKRLVAPTVKNGVTRLTCRTGEPEAVTCPKCIASEAYQRMTAQTQAQTQTQEQGA